MNLCRVSQVTLLRSSRGLARQTWPQKATQVEEDMPELSEEDIIEEKRNKSRLRPRHFKKLYGQVQHLTADEEQVFPLSLQRKIYGKLGAASGISLAKLWPSKEEMDLSKEWESVAYPHSVHQMIDLARKEKQEEELRLRERQEDLLRKVAKLEGWKEEVRQRIAKKEKEAQQAKEKKDRLIEEVRQIFGFRIDPRDERFKEALLQKEREEKKASKAAKRQLQQQRMIERLKREAAGESTEKKSSDSVTISDQTKDPSNILSGSSIV